MLQRLLSAYLLSHDLASGSCQQLRLTVACFERWLGRPAKVLDFTEETANRWLLYQQERGLAPDTVLSQRRNLLTLWRACWEERRIDTLPLRVRRIKCHRLPTRAWSGDDVSRLLATVHTLQGRFKFSMVSRAHFMGAWIRTQYETGLRFGDMLRIERQAIDPTGRFTLVQHKTRFPIYCQLYPETLSAILDTFPPSRRLVFGGVVSEHWVRSYLRQLTDKVGLSGSTKMLRRAGATAVKMSGGDASAFLGHRTPGLAERHYIDWEKAGLVKPLPPRLSG